MELIWTAFETVPIAIQSACMVPPSPVDALERSLPQVPSWKYNASATFNTVDPLPELVAVVKFVPPSIAPEVPCKLKSGRVLLAGLEISGLVNFGSPDATHPPLDVCGPVHQLLDTAPSMDQPLDGIPLLITSEFQKVYPLLMYIRLF